MASLLGVGLRCFELLVVDKLVEHAHQLEQVADGAAGVEVVVHRVQETAGDARRSAASVASRRGSKSPAATLAR